MKCELSVAKETGAAPLPVIGLATFPKNPLSPALHLLLPCSVLLLLLLLRSTSPFHSSLQAAPVHEAAFLGFGGAWQRWRSGAGGYGRLWLPHVGID